jgi:hypothetical protein
VPPGVFAGAAEDPQVSRVVRDFWRWRREAVDAIVDRADLARR